MLGNPAGQPATFSKTEMQHSPFLDATFWKKYLQKTIYKWQNGCCLPSIDNLVVLAAVLGTTVDAILVCEEEPSEDITSQFEMISRWQRMIIQLNRVSAQN